MNAATRKLRRQNEAKVVRKVKDVFREVGAWHYKTHGGPYGTPGIPDVLAVVNGLMFAVECKSGSNRPTPHQRAQLRLLRKSGAMAAVVNEDNLDAFVSLVRHAAAQSSPRVTSLPPALVAACQRLLD